VPAVVSRDLPLVGRGGLGVVEVAALQHGLVTRGQLVALGFSAKAIEHRVRGGLLHRVHRGVFAVGHGSLSEAADHAAALLYAGDDTVISHDSAAAVWGLASSPSFVAITMIGRHARGQPNLHVHEVSVLDIRDVRLHQGFPVTAPARTLIDCATNPTIDRMLNEARALRLVADKDIHQAIARCPGRTGVAGMRALLEAEADSGFTRSEAERRLKRLVEEAEIERPIFNQPLLGYKPDALWPRQRVILEVDGYGFHGHRQAFERDRARDARLVAAGYVVIRVTWRQLTQRPSFVAATIARTLARRDTEVA
jgi:very-short-patch-repair endonuclease